MTRDGSSVRPSGRTIAVAVFGFSAAAFVTSVSALRFGNHAQSVRVAIVGGTVILAACALIAIACGLRLARRRERVLWIATGGALVLTSAGSGIRAWGLIAGKTYSTGVAEASYVAGLVVMLVVSVGWTLLRRKGASLWLLVAEVATACAAGSLAFWFLGGRGLVEAAMQTEALTELQMRQFLGLLSVVAFGAALVLATAWTRWGREPVTPLIMLGAAIMLMLVGDVAWLSMMVGRGWAPGSLSDFVHISGHVLVATAASLALDDREVSRPEA